MQTQPIQLPNIETCFLLQDLGVLPPFDCTNVNVYKQNADGEYFNTIAFYDGNKKCNWDLGTSLIYIEAIFAPTADQLMPLITEKAKSLDIILQLKNEYLEFDRHEVWSCWGFHAIPPQLRNNLAQYLAEVLIYLLSKS